MLLPTAVAVAVAAVSPPTMSSSSTQAAGHGHHQPTTTGGGVSSHAHQPDDDERWRTWRGHRHQQQPQPRRYNNRRHRSGFVEWASAILFTVLAVAVLLSAVTILVVVLLLQPRAPYMSVRTATLDTLSYDQSGALDDVQLSIRVEARNDNAHSSAAFSRLDCRVAFPPGSGGATLLVLRADPFRVPAKGVLPLAYVARARGVPLGGGAEAMEAAIRDGVVGFGVEGEARTRWKVAGVVVVNQWTRLACRIRFVWPPNGTAIPFRCRSKSKFLFF